MKQLIRIGIKHVFAQIYAKIYVENILDITRCFQNVALSKKNVQLYSYLNITGVFGYICFAIFSPIRFMWSIFVLQDAGFLGRGVKSVSGSGARGGGGAHSEGQKD